MRHARAHRVAIIPTTQQYYELFMEAARKARRSILIAGWDFQPELKLIRDENEAGEVERRHALGEFLTDLAKRFPFLQIRIIAWNYSLLLAKSKELASEAEWIASLPDNVKVEFDPAEKFGGAHHHKIVVVDDNIAFVGGTDLSVRRWDSSDRPPQDPRRTDPVGEEYPPWHDVQMLVEGDAARALGDIVRDQWRGETDEILEPIERDPDGVWPSVDVDFEDVNVRFARTWPSSDEQEADDIEQLYFDLIERARNYIYVENQYLSHDGFVDALARRLEAPDGPEVVLVLPGSYRTKREELSFGRDRDRKAHQLRQADKHDRLRVLTPWTCDDDAECEVYVHSKLLIIDDEAVAVGSANFADRSMNVDTEVVACLTKADGAQPGSIRRIRDRLLGLHTGRDADEVADEVDRAGSLHAFLDSLDDDRGPTLREMSAGPRTPLIPMWFADPKRSLARQWQLWVTVFVALVLALLIGLVVAGAVG